jgi:hypothetical protein
LKFIKKIFLGDILYLRKSYYFCTPVLRVDDKRDRLIGERDEFFERMKPKKAGEGKEIV